ncbi:hypothetical protein PoB_000580000 [Plakobranchus ocellatus]|uniref:Uncharacterized protein n=1 Tax=Plakobranchus ocellatus TaxID=259542 RepID=A0AAV3Y842_9GAST|nr:hypothetical protein PoB_000580000 [Plakobranchus ocellatus]
MALPLLRQLFNTSKMSAAFQLYFPSLNESSWPDILQPQEDEELFSRFKLVGGIDFSTSIVCRGVSIGHDRREYQQLRLFLCLWVCRDARIGHDKREYQQLRLSLCLWVFHGVGIERNAAATAQGIPL